MFHDIADRMTKEGPENNKGTYDAYGGGKTYDPWGKKFFHNFPFETADESASWDC